MPKKAAVTNLTGVTIPADLLKKFQTEGGALMMRRLPVAGILMIPNEVLARMGYGSVTKAGFQVLVVPAE